MQQDRFGAKISRYIGPAMIGQDHFNDDSSYATYSIDAKTEPALGYLDHHRSMIQVYGDEALRDLIVRLLNEHYIQQTKAI